MLDQPPHPSPAGLTNDAPASEYRTRPESASACDVVVVGGGPAGSTMAALLAEAGWHVVMLEKERHPRFHIGESLLPHNIPVFERLGVLGEVDAIGLRKPGADFNSNLEVTGRCCYRFGFALDGSQPFAYQVLRSEFDHLLARNAHAKGAEVREGVRVESVEFRAGGDPVVHARDSDGHGFRLTARYLVDASGRDTLLARQLGLKQRNPRHSSAAMFAHFDGVVRRSGEDEGVISIYWFEHGWFWTIPLRDGTMSVGAVCRPEYLRERTRPAAEFFTETLALAHPELRERMSDARLKSEVWVTGNYSYGATRMRGERWMLVGDAYAFVDPVFSSGVLLGMTGALRGAEALDAWLRHERGAERKFRHFERMADRGIDTFSWFIERFHTPAMRRLLVRPANPFGIQQAVTSLLAGDVVGNRGARVRLWLFKALFHGFTAKFAWERSRDANGIAR